MIDRIHPEPGTIPAATEEAKEQAMALAACARERLGRISDALQDFTRKQPAKAVGLALGMGVFLGWLMKRR